MWNDIEKIKWREILIYVIFLEIKKLRKSQKYQYFKVSSLWEAVQESLLGRLDWFYKILLIIVA